ncbi:MAG TPA: KEOPS complex kinase/ATPase Bud32 [Conexivisphaerales archaeon]|nr:KEOPS complex kinase/ATPase Bud32 [Conexivisphaerales archaeon]
MERLIRRGAEADILLGRWLTEKAVFKVRTKRAYMIRELDERMREARTSREAELLSAAKRMGVPTPLVFHVDLAKYTIVMQYLEGPRLKELLQKDEPRIDLCETMGSLMARLHAHGVVHGDPTTSNLILSGGKLALIDFGLSYRSGSVEDIAVDLHLVKEVLQSAHSSVSRAALEEFREGYLRESGAAAEQIWRRVADIERRGRYARSEWGGD